jgi:hypothetical protein
MKKLLTLLPSHFDWHSAAKDGLVFGMTVALALHLLPALSRAALSALGRTGHAGLDDASSAQR